MESGKRKYVVVYGFLSCRVFATRTKSSTAKAAASSRKASGVRAQSARVL